MNFKVEVETDSLQYDNVAKFIVTKPKSLLWNIDVKIDSKRTDREESDFVPDFTVTQLYNMRKLSSTSQLIERLGKGRKVSRQGEFLVFTEKYGLLTTQNGTQQEIERRVKLDYGDYQQLVELGY